jgi:hypothetical protein
MPYAVEVDILTVLETAGVGTVGVDLYAGPLRGTPIAAVAVLPTGGYPPITLMDAAHQDRVKSTVQINIRSEINDYVGGLTLGRAIIAALHKLPPVGYTECVVTTPDPIYIGEEKQGAHRWSINVELLHFR